MRQIDPISLTKFGVESIIVVQVDVGAVLNNYADKTYTDFVTTVEGRILELSGLDSVVGITGAGSSGSVTIKLDDSDGVLKGIFDSIDLHLRAVNILQWFRGISFANAYDIFNGVINSPIVWDQHERTLTITAVSKIEDGVFGFTAGDAPGSDIPAEAVGKSWPFVFGSVNDVPVSTFQHIPDLANLFNSRPFGFLRWRYGNEGLQEFADSQAFFYEAARLIQGAVQVEAAAVVAFINGDQTTANSLAAQGYQFRVSAQTQQLAGVQKLEDGDTKILTAQQTVLQAMIDYQNSNYYFNGSFDIPDWPLVQAGVSRLTVDIIGPYGVSVESKGGYSSNITMTGGYYFPKFQAITIVVGRQIPDANDLTYASGKYYAPGAQGIDRFNVSPGGAQYSGPSSLLNPASSSGMTPTSRVMTPVTSPTLYFSPGAVITADFHGGNANTSYLTNVVLQSYPPFPPLPALNIITAPLSTSQSSQQQLTGFTQPSFVDPDELPNILVASMAQMAIPPNVILPGQTTPAYVAGGCPSFIIPLVPTAIAPINVDGGTSIQVNFQAPISYYVAANNVAVTAVRSMYHNQLRTVPSKFYSISYQDLDPDGHFPSTVLSMGTPLSYINSAWSNDLFVWMQGPSLTIAGVMSWIVTNFTALTIVFHGTNTLLNSAANFMISDHKSISGALADLARCCLAAVWIAKGVVNVRPLDILGGAVDTFTENDIIIGSLNISIEPTENLITKVVASWYSRYYYKIFDDPYKTVFLGNYQKYGIHEEDIDYWMFTDPSLIYYSADWWLWRKGQSFKIVSFKTALNKLNIEAYDTVELNFAGNYASNGPVLGLVQKALYDSKDNTIEFEVLIQVPNGSMTAVTYTPSAFQNYTPIYEQDSSVGGGTIKNPLSVQGLKMSMVAGQLNTGSQTIDWGNDIIPPDFSISSLDVGGSQVSYPSSNIPNATFTTAVDTPSANAANLFGVTKITPAIPVASVPSGLNLSKLNPDEQLLAIIGTGIPCVIVSLDPTSITNPSQLGINDDGTVNYTGANLYIVNAFTKGLNNPYFYQITAKQMQLAITDTIPANTYTTLNVVKIMDIDLVTVLSLEYYIQLPIWLPAPVAPTS
jgi:hypothetical protein